MTHKENIMAILECYFGGFKKGIIDSACNRILEQEPKTEHWIPVSERLPEEKGEYLVTYHPCYWDNVLQDIKVGLDTFRGKKWAKVKYQRVIAWMPLLKPYEPQESEE